MLFFSLQNLSVQFDFSVDNYFGSTDSCWSHPKCSTFDISSGHHDDEIRHNLNHTNSSVFRIKLKRKKTINRMFQSVLRQNVCKLRSASGWSGLLRLENTITATQTATFTKLLSDPNRTLCRPSLSHGTNCVSSQTPIAKYCDAPTEPKKKKKKNNPPAVDHVGRLDLRVGKIVEVSKAPDADTLYLTKVDCGEGYKREIVAGLAKFVPAEELANRSVVVLCNLKPSKLRGHLSEGMILCATAADSIEPIVPPENAQPGDIVHCESYDRAPVETPRNKNKLFDPIAVDLKTNDELVACYKGSHLYVPGKGSVVTKTLKNVQIT